MNEYVPALGRPLIDELLEPHKSYLRAVDEARAVAPVRALAHVTGGGMAGNLERVLPHGCGARLTRGTWPVLPIFRLIQELMNNAVEHGQASTVQINVDMAEAQVRVAVEDNGSGFEINDVLNSPDADRLGLATMRERIDMLGGEIRFDSSTGRGTKISFELPAA